MVLKNPSAIERWFYYTRTREKASGFSQEGKKGWTTGSSGSKGRTVVDMHGGSPYYQADWEIIPAGKDFRSTVTGRREDGTLPQRLPEETAHVPLVLRP
jgi:hypothetical protein